jgi:hypothetical protein
MRIFFSIALLLFVISYGYGLNLEPPAPLPVPVKCTFTLTNLEELDTKNEHFTVRAYFTFQWSDPRLVFKANDENPEIFREDNAKNKLGEIWSPDVEFVNAIEVAINSRGLFIYPNGNVKYEIFIRGTFHTNMDFRKFPFDQQELPILVESFIWNDKQLSMIAYQGNEELLWSSYLPPERDIIIKDIKASVKEVNEVPLGPGGRPVETYSTYVVTIVASHGVIFYFFQAFIPIFIIMAFVNLSFFDRDAPLIGKISAANLGFVALIALKFANGTDIPHINYMTILDQIFLVAYLFLGVDVILKIIDYWLRPNNPDLSNRLNFHSRWVYILSFLCICVLLVAIQVLA